MDVLASCERAIEPCRFLKTCSILLSKPHLINPRLAGCEMLRCTTTRDEITVQVDPSTLEDMELEVNEELCLHRRLISKNPSKNCSVVDRCLLTFSSCSFRVERAVRNTEDASPVAEVGTEYLLKLDDQKHLVLLAGSCVPFPQRKFLSSHVFPRIVKWSTAPELRQNQLTVNSLSQINIETYSRLYSDLKGKYGKKLVEMWPERTDPLKFVYEDIAIASYLMAFWDPEMSGRRTSFIDVGCGNGLLVYILTAEGHTGIGIDLRKRAIWDMYPTSVILKEYAVTPESRFPEYEWWIGNHSDELTPWIPYLATMSNPCSKVFLLPCCPFSFFGKFQRTNPSMSQYQTFLVYLKHELLPNCGFNVLLDKLRIPSTKRVCLIAAERSIAGGEEYNSIVAKLASILEKEEKFVPRERDIKVRNCTQIDRALVSRVVDKIANELLEKGNNCGGLLEYNKGGRIHLKELVEMLTNEELTAMKSQCGGLQTMLKNNYHVFKVQRGEVCLNVPQKMPLPQKGTEEVNWNRQSRKCWFFANHPMRCPMDAENCKFQH